MQKIKLRTKFEIISLVAFITIMVTISAAAITRTITDTGDNSYTFIRNSKGNYWECTGANIQTAIDDLGANGGTVWVGSAVTLNSPIKPKNYITIDFQGNFVTLGSDISFVNVTACRYAAVKNANIPSVAKEATMANIISSLLRSFLSSFTSTKYSINIGIKNNA